jgi:hypothetical protein
MRGGLAFSLGALLCVFVWGVGLSVFLSIWVIIWYMVQCFSFHMLVAGDYDYWFIYVFLFASLQGGGDGMSRS